MSETASAPTRAWARLEATLAPPAPALVALAAYAAIVFLSLPDQVTPDTWLALVSGREIVQHGLPHHDHLAVWTHGRTWTDQQWLGQLVLYGLNAAGGLKLVFVVHALILVTVFWCAQLAARRLGGSWRTAAVVGFFTIFIVSPIRTQALALPLFLATLYLLAADSRRASRRVLLVFPVLAIWANVHGSAVLGAVLCVVAGVASLATRSRRDQFGVRTRSAALILSPALLFASPYAIGLPSYYHQVLLNPTLSKLVLEWQPSTPGLITAPFYLLAFAATWVVARHGSRLTRFELCALVLMLAAALGAIRNIPWFALTALVLVPPALQGARWVPRLPGRFRPIVAVGATLCVCAVLIASVVRPLSSYERRWPTQGADTVAAAASSPTARVFADDRFADWLLWKRPELRGRIAYDVRFELLTHSELEQLFHFDSRIGDSWRRAAAGYSILVISTKYRGALWRALSQDRGSRTLFDAAGVGVLALR